MENELSARFQRYAVSLVEQLGGVVEWEPESTSGVAVAPLEVSQCFRQESDTFVMTTQSGEPGLQLGMGNDFLDMASQAMQRFVPSAGSFAIPDVPVKKTDFQHAVDAVFGWQNARARVLQGNVLPIAYHTWWFHVVLQADEAWETLIRITLNAHSQLSIEMGDLLESMQLSKVKHSRVTDTETLNIAAGFAEVIAIRQCEDFLTRTELRRERDRKRLKDYYAALSKQASVANKRTKVVPSEDEIEAKNRAVKLELQRKLGELNDRYSFSANVRPIAMLECSIPGVVIDLEIQRKAATRIFKVYWNGLLRRIEPLQCTQCSAGSFNLWFTNDDVRPICHTCHNKTPK